MATLPGNEPGGGKARRNVIVGLLLLAVVGGGVAYGVHRHQVSEDRKAQKAAVAKRLADAKRKREKERAAKAAAQAACHSEYDPLVQSLTDLQSEISIGLNYDEYGDAVRGVRVKYGRVDFDNTPLECTLSVGAPAEKALNRYAEAYNIWNRCQEDVNCAGVDEIDSKMQAKWTKADGQLKKAEAGFEKVTPDGTG